MEWRKVSGVLGVEAISFNAANRKAGSVGLTGGVRIAGPSDGLISRLA